MVNKTLTEYTPIVLNESQLRGVMDVTSNAPMLIKHVLLQRANAKNRNGRIYPREILEREITKYNNDFVKTRRALGELDHFEKPEINLKNVSHLITEMYWEGDDVYGDIEILDGPEFPSGRIAAGLLRRKIPVGISSRGMGSVTELEESIMVNDDFMLSCFDLVSFESTQGSNLNLNEGFNMNNKNNRIDSLLHDLICNNSGACSCMFGNKKS